MKTNCNATTFKVTEKQIEGLMKKYSLRPEILYYLKQGKVAYSYITPDVIGLSDISENVEYESAMKQFEEEKNGHHVYFAILSDTAFGRLLSFLYVEDSKKPSLPKDNLINVYVVNLDCPECSEFGKIEICNYRNSGVLFRIW